MGAGANSNSQESGNSNGAGAATGAAGVTGAAAGMPGIELLGVGKAVTAPSICA
jgi:hypothetical protein